MAAMAACAGAGGAAVCLPRAGVEREFSGLRCGVVVGRRAEQLSRRLVVDGGVARVRMAGLPLAPAPGAVGVRIGAVAGVAAPEVAKMPSKQKIRIKLRSYWVPLIEQACKQILEAARNTNSKTMGPVPLPTKRRLYCLLRSPHVDKDSREHFEIRTHRRLIDLENPNAQTIDALMQLDLPAGVDVEVKLT